MAAIAGWVGKPVLRKEDEPLLTGHGYFMDDVEPVAGMQGSISAGLYESVGLDAPMLISPDDADRVALAMCPTAPEMPELVIGHVSTPTPANRTGARAWATAVPCSHRPRSPMPQPMRCGARAAPRKTLAPQFTIRRPPFFRPD